MCGSTNYSSTPSPQQETVLSTDHEHFMKQGSCSPYYPNTQCQGFLEKENDAWTLQDIAEACPQCLAPLLKPKMVLPRGISMR